MKRSVVPVVLLLAALLAPFAEGCGESSVAENGSESPLIEELTGYTVISSIVEGAQARVDAVRALQPTDIPDHLTGKLHPTKTGEEFDINEYFSVLTHLSMEPGYVLDYVYYWIDFWGFPRAYVRRVGDKPLSNDEEYTRAEESSANLNETDDFVGFVMGGDPDAPENKIRIDGTAEGFFEYVILQIMGTQFYLDWHANYNDARIICNQESLEIILESLDSGVYDRSVFGSFEEFLAAARNIDCQPTVTFHADTVVVRIVFFTGWEGFIQSEFTISRNYPHRILNIKEKTLLYYECGIVF